jgi:hypothetical protein
MQVLSEKQMALNFRQTREVFYSPKSSDRFWGAPSPLLIVYWELFFSNLGYAKRSAEHARRDIPLTYSTSFLRIALIKAMQNLNLHMQSLELCFCIRFAFFTDKSLTICTTNSPFNQIVCRWWSIEVEVKGKTILVTTWTGREGARMLRLPDLRTVGTWRR